VGSGGSATRIDFAGTQTLGGTGSVLFSSAISNEVRQTSGTLTIGPGIRLHGQAGTIGALNHPLINRGTIDSDVPGGSLTITGSGWSNSGLIQATNGAALNLAGTFSTLGLGDFRGTAGNINITGTLNNSFGPLLLTAPTGAFTPFIVVSGGLTLNGVAYLGLGTTSARLDFAGSQTLGGTGEVLLANSSSNVIRPTSGTLTIGPGIRVHGQAGAVGLNTLSTVNQGTVSADLAGSSITLPGTDWFNQGRVSASGGNCTASGAFWNAESVLVGAGRSFTANVAYTQTAGLTLLQKGTLGCAFPVVIAGGQLAGAGTVAGGLELDGTLSPGTTPDTLRVTGNYTQRDGGRLVVDLAGLSPGVTHDVVRVSGAAALAGRLQVRLGNGFVPVNGDSFLVMTYASRTGTFSLLDLPWLLPTSAWQVYYGSSYLALRVVSPGSVSTVEEIPEAPGAALPAAFALHAGTPNPFRSFTQIRYDLPAPGRVTLSVFDISGRRVVDLLNDVLKPAGRHGLRWDGRDGAGRELPQGIYFCRFDAGGRTDSQRIVRLR
jgi:hypothetical protein